jgi:hypothetical protein
MTNKTDDLGIADTSLLTDSDWAEINKLKRAYDEGGLKALSKALEELKKDPVRTYQIMAAFYPEKMRKQQKMSSQNLE